MKNEIESINMDDKYFIAIVLAAGQGKRMHSETAKQYMNIHGKPMLYYSLKAFDESDVDEIIVVVGKEEIEYCKQNIIEKYNIKKECTVIAGGSERYNSVYQALEKIESCSLNVGKERYVLIHDAARPMLTQSVIKETIKNVVKHKAVAVGVQSKDTIKVANEEGVIDYTPKRSLTYVIQTPQAFEYSMLMAAYEVAMDTPGLEITDDAMIVEHGCSQKVYIVPGEYTNIKVTTPEDINIIEMFMNTIGR